MFASFYRTRVLLTGLSISVGLFICSIVLILVIFPNVINNEIRKSVTLTKHSEQYDRFVEIPFPIIFKVYLFNVENPSDILNGSKPIIKEVGPYVYKQYRKKTIFDINEKEDTISYTQREIFKFDPDSSGGLSDEDYVTTLNAPMISALQTAEKLHQTKPLSNCLSKIFPNLDTVFIQVKVKDMLFDGLQFCSTGPSRCILQQTIFCSIAESYKIIDKLDNNSLKFSFFNYKVKTHDGLYTIKRGVKDVKTLGNIVSINNSTYTNFWNKKEQTSSCNKIEGGDGTIFPPDISKNSMFETYSTDICRSIKIYFLKEESYKGINGYMFGANNLTLRAGTPRKEDDCFCANETKGINGEDNCFLDGVIDIQPCIDAPVLLSFPHFLWADRTYKENVIGLKPVEDLHRTYVTLEPATGTPLDGAKRIQINAVLRPIKHISQTKNVPRVVLPILWIEEGFSLTDYYINELKNKYFNKLQIIEIIQWAFFGISILLFLVFATLLLNILYQKLIEK